ncbi:MAG TPA: hypothetical protein VLH79_07635, partial [Chthonomonadales bacterium]|nr:hypothetical protein [Chthonomonadales bacterium]
MGRPRAMPCRRGSLAVAAGLLVVAVVATALWLAPAASALWLAPAAAGLRPATAAAALRLPPAAAALRPATAAAAPSARPDAWDRVLALAGLTRETCRFDELDMAQFGGHRHLLAYFDALHRDPLRIPFTARSFRLTFAPATRSAGEAVMRGGARIGHGIRRTLLGDPNAEEARRAAAPGALAAAVRGVLQMGGRTLTPAQDAILTRTAAAVPTEVARQAAFLLLVEMKALRRRQQAFADATPAQLDRAFEILMRSGPPTDAPAGREVEALRASADLNYLFTGAVDLAVAVDAARDALAARPHRERFSFTWETPYGWIVLRGGTDDVTTGDRPYLLIVDTSGNDRYAGGGATFSARHPVSVLLDIEGSDRYIELAGLEESSVAQYAGRRAGSRRPTFGAGILGYGILADASGDDRYAALCHTQGRGALGIGVLIDSAGADRYDAYTFAQGSAEFGLGALCDSGGADEYRCFTASQGFGGTMGCGLLLDGGLEDDLYEANDTVIDFPSPQDRAHNASLAQGCGFGRRADHLDGRSLAGGVGALLDLGGNNRFVAGVFAQGVGYWYGVGLLCSGPGNDQYEGVWYVQ